MRSRKLVLGASWACDDGTLAADGVRRMNLKSSGRDQTRARVKGGDVGLPDPSMPLSPASFPVVVQLPNSDTSTCFESIFTAEDVRENTEGLIELKH